MWKLYVEKLNILKYKISIYEHSKNILPQNEILLKEILKCLINKAIIGGVGDFMEIRKIKASEIT